MFSQLRKLFARPQAPPNAADQDTVLPQVIAEPFTKFVQSTQLQPTQKLIGTPLIAVDFETSGLEAHDRIVSMGFCQIVDWQIKLSASHHIIVNANPELKADNVAIHKITHDQITKGIDETSAFIKLLTLCRGAVIVAHYHRVEEKYLQNLALQLTGRRLPLNFIDTFVIAKNAMARRQQAITPNSLRLFNLRKNYGLPCYNAHNALEDAISTAELLLAQTAAMNLPLEKITLKDLSLIQIP